MTDVKPVVGMAATMQVGSDSYPATVIKVSPSGTQATLAMDEYRVVSGDGSFQKGHPVIEYTPGDEKSSPTRTIRLTKRGWASKGTPVYLGHREYYRDPSF